jgi:hypothetical protein
MPLALPEVPVPPLKLVMQLEVNVLLHVNESVSVGSTANESLAVRFEVIVLDRPVNVIEGGEIVHDAYWYAPLPESVPSLQVRVCCVLVLQVPVFAL